MRLVVKLRLRAASILLLMLTVGLGPMARSMADSDKAERSGEDSRSRAPEKPGYSIAGVLTAYGNVTVNDNLARTGTTVLNGSAVATGGDGVASIDLGPKGIIELKTNTKILLTLPTEQIEVDLENCGTLTQSVPNDLSAHVKLVTPHTVRIYVPVGMVKVRFGDRKETTINQFEEKTLDDVSDINAAGNAVFSVDCNRRPPGAWWIPTSLIGLAALAAGITAGRQNGTPNPVPSPSPLTALKP
jgi:hypothetical protein